MTFSHDARSSLRQSLLEVVRRDERVVGLVEGGSGAEDRVDQWSDLDVFLFIRDVDVDAFRQEWRQWTQQFGRLLLAYDPDEDNTVAWTIFEAYPVPLRVDFRFLPASDIDKVPSWPTSPSSLDTFVLCDKTGSHLSEIARSLVGQSQRLPSSQEHNTFAGYCDRMWYFLHSAYCKLERGNEWYARISLHIAVLDSLTALLKLEAGATEHWLASFPERNLERVLSPARLNQLNECIPLVGPDAMKQAMHNIAYLGRDVCDQIAAQHGWDWPREAAEAVIEMLRSYSSQVL